MTVTTMSVLVLTTTTTCILQKTDVGVSVFYTTTLDYWIFLLLCNDDKDEDDSSLEGHAGSGRTRPLEQRP